MSASKDAFLQDQDLAKWLSGVVKDPRFDKVLVFARAEFMESYPESGALRGAKSFETILTTLCENEPEPVPVPTSGIDHNLEERRSTSTDEPIVPPPAKPTVRPSKRKNPRKR